MNARTGALRRRRKPSLATRLRIFWVFIVFVIGAAAYGGYVLVTLPELRPHPIEVHVDGSALAPAQVLQAASIDPTANVWLLDTGKIAQRIEALPYADRATVAHRLPAGLAIDVTVRGASRCVRSGANAVTIDDRRRILETGCAQPGLIAVILPRQPLGAPGATLSGAATAGLLGDIAVLQAAGIGVRSVRYDRFGQLVAVDTHDLTLLLGSDADVAAKAKLVAPVSAGAPAGRPLRAIDLRAPGTPIVEFR